MMGEARALLLRKLPNDSVHPKRDALRIIKGLLAAQKTVFGIKEVNAWRILEELMARDAGNLQTYTDLEDALSFIEVFRFLYQLLEVQEEKILLKEDGSRAQLESAWSVATSICSFTTTSMCRPSALHPLPCFTTC
jgi:hypothetical protein